MKVTLWKGQRVNQGYPISQNPQTAFSGCWLAAGCCHTTLWPVQLFEEAITWLVTSDKRRKWWREELSSRLSLLVSDRRRLLDCSHTLAYFSHLIFPSEIILTWVVYLPLRKVWIQGRPNNASQQSRSRSKEKQNTAGNSLRPCSLISTARGVLTYYLLQAGDEGETWMSWTYQKVTLPFPRHQNWTKLHTSEVRPPKINAKHHMI